MREVLFRIVRALVRADADPLLLDHVPVESLQRISRDGVPAPHTVRMEKLAEAHRRHGRAFKCAARDLPAEVMTLPGSFRIMKAGRPQTRSRPELSDPAHARNVEPFLRRRT